MMRQSALRHWSSGHINFNLRKRVELRAEKLFVCAAFGSNYITWSVSNFCREEADECLIFRRIYFILLLFLDWHNIICDTSNTLLPVLYLLNEELKTRNSLYIRERNTRKMNVKNRFYRREIYDVRKKSPVIKNAFKLNSIKVLLYNWESISLSNILLIPVYIAFWNRNIRRRSCYL